MNEKARRLCILTLIVLIFVHADAMTTTAAETVVRIEPVTQSLAAGNAFSITVVVEDVLDMAGDQATLNFDAQAMTVSSVTEGDFLKSAGTTIGAGMEKIDNENGRVTFFYAVTTRGTSVNGSGALATVNFDTNPSVGGIFTLNLTDLLLVSGTGDLLDIDVMNNGTLTLSGSVPTSSPTPDDKKGGGSGGGSYHPTSEPTPLSTLTATPTASVTTTPSPTSTYTPLVTPETANPTKTPPEPTATPKSSGFSAVLAIVGLFMALYLLWKKRS